MDAWQRAQAIPRNCVRVRLTISRSGLEALQGIAQQAYGDAGLWYLIAEANGLSGNADLKVGQTLSLPASAGSVHNTATTTRPYDPGRVIGDTSPNLPKPAGQGGGCGAMGIIIVVVVTVAVTMATQDYMTAIGPMNSPPP